MNRGERVINAIIIFLYVEGRNFHRALPYERGEILKEKSDDISCCICSVRLSGRQLSCQKVGSSSCFEKAISV